MSSRPITSAALVLAFAIACHAAEFHLAPSGNDASPGTQAKPFATLERAQKAARASKGSTVWLHNGSYILNKTFVLTPEDSDTAYCAAKGETPKLTGGRPITGWKRVEQEPAGVTAAAKGKLWVADVPKGWCFHYLYVDGQPVPRARLHDTHWRKWSSGITYTPPSADGQVVTFMGPNKAQLANVPANGDLEMTLVMAQYGVMGNGVLTKVDPEAGTAVWNSRQTYMGFRNFLRAYTLENAVPFINQPGEWCVDSTAGKVYIWPPSGDMSKAEAVAPKLYELIRLEGNTAKEKWVEHVTLSGLTMTCTDRLPEDQWPSEWVKRQWEHPDAMLYVQGAKDCTFSGNRLLFSGASGITFNQYAQGNRVEGNEIGWNGSDGVLLCGYGPGTLDVNQNNIVSRNWIHDMGLGKYWHSNGLQICQSGHNQITRNLIQNSAYSAISIVGVSSYYLNKPEYVFKDDPAGNANPFKLWEMFGIRSQDFTQEMRDGVMLKAGPTAKGQFRFNRENAKPYAHSRNNLVENNIVVEPEQLLDEGGGIYAYSCGKDNVWKDNIVFKSSGMPASGVLALDNDAEYFTVTGNVVWLNGAYGAGCGIAGARPTERGVVIKDNIRVMTDWIKAKRPPGSKWWSDEDGRASLDNLEKTILDQVNKDGGWPGNPKTGIPGPGESIKPPSTHELPPGSHMTIE